MHNNNFPQISNDKYSRADSVSAIIGYLLGVNLIGLILAAIVRSISTTHNLGPLMLLLAFGGFIVVAIAWVLIVIFLIVGFRKVNQRLDNSSFSPQRKKLLRGIIVANLLAYLVLWVLLAVTGQPVKRNNWNHHTKQVKTKVEKELVKQYQKAGYHHFKISVSDVQDPTTEASNDLEANYTYSEKVDHRTYHKTGYLEIEPDSYKIAKMVSFKPEEEDFYYGLGDEQGNSSLVQPAPYFQPQVIHQFNKEKLALSSVLKSGQHITLTGSLEASTHSDQYKALLQQVEDNKKAGKPLGGYYDLDVKSLAANHTLFYAVTVHNQHQWSNKKVDNIYQQLKKKDYSQFWPGHYALSFEDSGNYQNLPDSHAIKFTVTDDGQLQDMRITTESEEDSMTP